eukprot:PhF_6_TR5543/c0_g1_i1/m.7901
MNLGRSILIAGLLFILVLLAPAISMYKEAVGEYSPVIDVKPRKTSMPISSNTSLHMSIAPLIATTKSTTSPPSPPPSKASSNRFEVITHYSLPHPTCLSCVQWKQNHNGKPLQKELGKCGCHKHGGHYNPGYARMNGTYLTLRNVVWYQGKCYADVRSPQKLYYSGHFTMVSGNWPQLVFTEFDVFPLKNLKDKQSKSFEPIEVAYYQPPTDFMSVYHVQVEVTLPMWHRLRERIMERKPTLVLTQRPTFTRYGFKPGSCNEGPVCLKTLWAQMYGMAVGGIQQIVGLDSTEQQKPFMIKELYVGNPTHCEPLWGPDAWYNYNEFNAEFRKSDPALADCHQLFRSWKEFYIRMTLGDSSRLLTPLQSNSPLRILYVTRKGAWARHLVNEEDLINRLEQQYLNEGLRVDVVYFKGNLSKQLAPLTETTIFIGGHGAGLFQSLYLRKGAGVITLSVMDPGFYPLLTIPNWLYWENVMIDQTYNMRLFGGKKKMSNANNNDCIITKAQIDHVVDAIERIRQKQRDNISPE